MFCAQFMPNQTGRRKKGEKVSPRWFLVPEKSYADALMAAAPILDWLNDTVTSCAWRFFYLHAVEESDVPSAEPMLNLPEKYQNRYYRAKHCYGVRAVEGTRLLNLKDDGRTGGYGAQLINYDTDETCYACTNGKFYTHQDILRMKPSWFPENSFPYHPVVFPYMEDGKINLSHYIASNTLFAFPIQFWCHESYDRQLEWLSEQEGLKTE